MINMTERSSLLRTDCRPAMFLTLRIGWAGIFAAVGLPNFNDFTLPDAEAGRVFTSVISA